MTAAEQAVTTVTLLTDFGWSDGYVGAMKGVIASMAPDARVHDAAHDLRPGDVTGAAIALLRYWRLYPSGTVHVAVVDPGVGSSRRGMAALVEGRYIVGPDNGLFTLVLRQAESAAVVSLEQREFFRAEVSATFHGRDVFAPVAAHLARGVSIEQLGPPLNDPVQLPWPEPRREQSGRIAGVVLHVDHYGNLISNIPGSWATSDGLVKLGDIPVGPVRRTYADVGAGQPIALVGSLGLLEISVRDGSAAKELRAGAGLPLSVVPAGVT